MRFYAMRQIQLVVALSIPYQRFVEVGDCAEKCAAELHRIIFMKRAIWQWTKRIVNDSIPSLRGPQHCPMPALDHFLPRPYRPWRILGKSTPINPVFIHNEQI